MKQYPGVYVPLDDTLAWLEQASNRVCDAAKVTPAQREIVCSVLQTDFINLLKRLKKERRLGAPTGLV